jgi:hypothetical protein
MGLQGKTRSILILPGAGVRFRETMGKRKNESVEKRRVLLWKPETQKMSWGSVRMGTTTTGMESPIVMTLGVHGFPLVRAQRDRRVREF